MSYPSSTSSIDFADQIPSSSTSYSDSLVSFSRYSDSNDLLSKSDPTSPTLSPTAPPPPAPSQFDHSPSNSTVIPLKSPIIVSFNKGSRHFKLRYSQVEILRDQWANLSQIVLTESHGVFIHRFVNARKPIPHVEQAVTCTSRSSLVVSFLESQTVTVAQMHFVAQPHYSFERWDDFIYFQETLFGERILFMAGISVAKSKGRGEECISQNLRVTQAKNGRRTITFFPNSQRAENKRYVFIPLDGVEGIGQGKKGKPPVTLRLRSTAELLGQLKALQFEFLDHDDQTTFWNILIQSVGAYSA